MAELALVVPLERALHKGQIYYGPRGGKYADPQLKIPYREGGGGRKAKAKPSKGGKGKAQPRELGWEKQGDGYAAGDSKLTKQDGKWQLTHMGETVELPGKRASFDHAAAAVANIEHAKRQEARKLKAKVQAGEAKGKKAKAKVAQAEKDLETAKEKAKGQTMSQGESAPKEDKPEVTPGEGPDAHGLLADDDKGMGADEPEDMLADEPMDVDKLVDEAGDPGAGKPQKEMPKLEPAEQKQVLAIRDDVETLMGARDPQGMAKTLEGAAKLAAKGGAAAQAVAGVIKAALGKVSSAGKKAAQKMRGKASKRVRQGGGSSAQRQGLIALMLDKVLTAITGRDAETRAKFREWDKQSGAGKSGFWSVFDLDSYDVFKAERSYFVKATAPTGVGSTSKPPGHGTPRKYTAALPDYSIYHQDEAEDRMQREEEATANRRRANAVRNSGKFGMHGQASPDVELRYEPGDYASPEYDDEHEPEIGQDKPSVPMKLRMAAGKITSEDALTDSVDDDEEEDETGHSRKKPKKAKLVARRV